MKVYALPDTSRAGHLDWYVAPLTAVEKYLAEHHRFNKLRDFTIPSAEAEVLGLLDNRRALIKGEFPDREGLKIRVALVEMICSSDENCGFINSEIPMMGDGRFLINLLLGSDSGETEIPLDVLAQVHSYTETAETEFQSIGHAPYANRAIQRLVLTMQNSSTKIAYSHSVGYFEGYQYDLFASKKSAYADAYRQIRQRAKMDWVDTECWECGAVYTDIGHVEPGQMGCDRCNN